MADPEDRLVRLLALGEPPARDPVFEANVAERIEHRRLLQQIVEGLVLAAAVLVVGWAAWPFLSQELIAFAPLLAVAAAAGLAVWSVDRTLERVALGGYEDFTRDFASE